MPRVRDVLLRFRPSGTPGAATAAGVPADRAAELATELGPVLDLLAETERTCAGILDDARVEEAEIRARGDARARQVLAAGRALVEPERVAAATRAHGAATTSVPGSSLTAAGGGTRVAVPEEALAHQVDLVVDAVVRLLRAGRPDDALPGSPP